VVRSAPLGAASPLAALALAAPVAYAVWRRWPSASRWLGRLPGDLHVRWGQTTLYVPLATMLVVSLALSALIGVASWALAALTRCWRGSAGCRATSWCAATRSLYAPIASMLLLGVLASALLALLRWLLPRRGGRRR
jgi:hypothetical protein